jgi:GntR family transcriptional regulator/MocR family aminotransferase
LPRRRTALELPIQLDPLIRNQGQRVRAALRSAIVDGLLGPGTKLPSSRNLAEQIGVRRNMIVAAYEYLISDGLVEARHGSGTFVAATLPTPAINVPAAKFRIRHVYKDAVCRTAAGLRRRATCRAGACLVRSRHA